MDMGKFPGRDQSAKIIPGVESLPKDRESGWNWSWARDADAIVEASGWAALGRICLYVEKDGDAWPEKKSAYHFPHGKMKGGTLTTYFRGVVAALQRLRGNPGSVSDYEAAERHLAAHYRQFDEEFPKGAPVDGKDHPMNEDEMRDKLDAVETDLASAKTELDEKTTKLTEAETALATAQTEAKEATDKLTAMSEERDALREFVEAEVGWYVQQLKMGEVVSAVAGEKGLGGMSPEQLKKLHADLREKHTATLGGKPKIEPGMDEHPDDVKPDDEKPAVSDEMRAARIQG
jgi:hypothetical protein